MAYATTDELATALRIRETPANTPILQACLDASAAEINHEIDWKPLESYPASTWLYSAATVAGDPGPGYLRLNKTSPPAVKAIYVSTLDNDGTDWADELAGAESGDIIRLSNTGFAHAWVQYVLNGPGTDHGSWFELPADFDRAGPSAVSLADGSPLLVAALRPSTVAGEKLALANRVNIVRAVEWYKANDAAFGVVGFDASGVLQAPRDSFNRHAFELTPLKQQWGLA